MATRPHVLLILSDDHAAQAIGAYGGPVPTPGCDRLAAEGAVFERAFSTNALCAPARASILTGTYGHVNGVTTLSTLFRADQETFPALLQQAGYQTALFGKWHLGHGEPHDPVGFDTWRVLLDQGEYVDPVLRGPGPGSPAGRGGPAVTQERVTGYTTDLITEMSRDWLTARDPDRPFCLLVHHKAPHRPWEPAPRHAEAFADVDLGVPPTFDDDYATRSRNAHEARMTVRHHLREDDLKVPVPTGLGPQAEALWKLRRYQEDYYRTAASMDEGITALLDHLDETGLAQDTLVVYASDQGFFLGEHGWYDKRFMYEESLRMPLLVRLPGVTEPGSRVRAMTLNVDLAPTVLELAGVPVPDRVQGRSLLPVLPGGDPPADWRTSVYYRYFEHDDGAHGVWAHYGVRTERHKLVYHYADGLGLPGTGPHRRPPEWELFDLEADPHEVHNVVADPAYAAVRGDLEAELARLQHELGDAPYVAQEVGA